MKKFGKLTVLALVLLCMTMLFATVSSAADLKDIKGHWAEEYIEYGVEKGYISGYADGTFLPDKTVTRAEFSKMINSALKITSAGNAKGDFTDVDEKHWYFEEVKKAEYAGYITGYEDGSFKPGNPITRQEAAVILSRIVLPTQDRSELDSFSDGDKIDSWAADAVSMIAAKNYIKGDEKGNFSPKGQLTRSQAAKLICELVKNENIVNKDQTVEDEDREEIVYSEILFTDNVVIKAPAGTTIVFKNCRVLGCISVEAEDVNVDLENSVAKEICFEAGDSTVTLDKASTVKTAHVKNPSSLIGNGFQNTYVDGDDLSSGTVSLKGTFANVAVTSDATLNLDVVNSLTVDKKVNLLIQTGTVEKLEVKSGAKGSIINLAKKAVVEKAENKGAVKYTGGGTIEYSNESVTGVTYDGVSVDEVAGKGSNSSNSSSTKTDGVLDGITVSPANKKTSVSASTNVTITFGSKVYDKMGEEIDANYVEDNFELRRGSAGGANVGYSATVTGSKRVTINPTTNLKNNTKYYLVIPEGTITNEDGDKNEEYISYFTTSAATDDSSSNSGSDDGDDDDVTVTFDPESGEKAPITTGIEIDFSEKVYKSSSKGTLTAAYCEDSAFEIRKGSASGDKVSFSAVVASTYKKVTLIPDDMLEPNTKYYVILLNKKLYDASGSYLSKESSYFTTEGGLAVSISPEDGATNVSTKPEIVLEFSETVLNYNGNALAAIDVEDGIVEIREKSKTGDAVGFEADVASGSKKITITPDELKPGTKYYIILHSETLVGKESEEENEEIVSYFTVASEAAPMITPADGKKNVGTEENIVIKFSGKLLTYTKVTDPAIAAKTELTNDNIQDYLDKTGCVKLRRNSETGTEVKCTATISDDGTTITLNPNASIAVNKDYYVVVKSNAFYVGSTSKKNSAATTTFSTNEALMPTFYPEDGDKGIGVDEKFTITFDESVFNNEGDALTKNDVVNDVVRLYKKSTEEDVEFSAKVSGRVITITPDEDLEGGTEYVLAVNAKTVTNSSGDENQGSSVTFKTEVNVIKTITYDPENKKTGVSIYVNPTITFASPVFKSGGGDMTDKYATNNIEMYKTTKKDANFVDISVEVSPDFKTFTICPEEPLEKDTKYLIYITASKFAYEDESLISSKSFYFTTTDEDEGATVECPICGGDHEEADCPDNDPDNGDENTGNGDTGNGDTDNENTGNENTGNENTGNGDTGNENTGNENTGNENNGNENTGN